MSEEKAKRAGRSIALSGFIGSVLAALLVGMIIGGCVALFVIAPLMHTNQQGGSTQGTSGNPNSNNQNGNNNPEIPGSQSGNYQNGNINPGNMDNQSSSQNENTSSSVNNNNPAPTDPTGQYGSSGCQFAVTIPGNGMQATGSITANVNCVVQQDGNNILLALTVTPTTIPQSLSQTMGNSPVTFNFAGTVSGSQFNAKATGTAGPDNTSSTFDFNLSGSFGSNKLTLSITSASDSQISVSTPQPITLQSNA